MIIRTAGEKERPSRANLARRVPGDLQREEEMRVDTAACRFDVELCERRTVGTRARDQHVVDRRRQLVEEPLEPVEVRRVEGRDAGSELETGSVEAVRVARRDDEVGSYLARAPGRLEPDAGTAADHDQGLSDEQQLAAHRVTSAARTCRIKNDLRAATVFSHQWDPLVAPLVFHAREEAWGSKQV